MKKLSTALIALAIGTPALAADAGAPQQRVDINTATEAQLQETLGVDAAEARKIIEARPYASKEDLKAKQVMSADEFEKLKKLIESVC
jgi:DNA uptake protein ComE-like DNA-binding protein